MLNRCQFRVNCCLQVLNHSYAVLNNIPFHKNYESLERSVSDKTKKTHKIIEKVQMSKILMVNCQGAIFDPKIAHPQNSVSTLIIFF